MKALKISGRPIVYKDANGQPVSYPVYDGLSPEPFMETMLPGVANDPSGKRNTLLFINHRTDALPLASEKGKTMDISDTPSALCFTAELDPENSQARDLASTLSRQDLTAMSVGFRVLSDSWSDDWMTRTVRSIELLEISAVNHPASASTSISLVSPESTAKKKKWDDDFGGPQGDQNAPYPYGGTMAGDGTGSRDKSRWTSAERRAGARAGGVEQRANLAGTLEVRAFTVWVPSPEVVPAVAPVKRRNGELRLERDLLRLHRHSSRR